MFKVLIADDERIIREGLSKLVDWESLDCHLVGIEKNGQNTLQRIKDPNKPTLDIVITDVMMPIMNGLDLIKETYIYDKNIVFIVLSGYNEFEYAKTAMAYGVKYYLLKPTSEDEIHDILKKACQDVIKKRRIDEATNIANVRLMTNKVSATVNDILIAIDENIGNPELSLKWIANNVLYMNEDYLGKQFKKEMNQNFSDYLRTKKITLAKELLLSESEKNIYEIFEMLGFDINTRYFSQVFKKYTGLTPSEYRKKHT